MAGIDTNAGYDDETKRNTINSLEVQIQAAISYVSCLEAEEDVVILIGLSKAGKSSLANFLTGVQLIGTRNARYDPITLQNVHKDNGAEIGKASASTTVIPRRYCSDKFVIWDTPGIDDNRNELRDIINAIYISELFKKVKSAKILLVMDIDNLTAQNVKLILTLLTAVENLFNKQLRQSFPAISMIITKVENVLNSIPVDRELITEMIAHKLLSEKSPKISDMGRDLLFHLIGNHSKIGLFKRPSESNIHVDDTIEDGIIEAIESTHSIQQEILKKITPSIAETSQVFLYRIRHELCSAQMLLHFQELVREVLGNILLGYKNSKNNKISYAELDVRSQELYAAKDKLEQASHDGVTLYAKLDTLKTLDARIANFIDTHDLYRKIRFAEITDTLLGMEESHFFHVSITQIFLFGLQEINSLFAQIQGKKDKFMDEETQQNARRYAEKIECLEKMLKEMKEQNEKLTRQSEFIAQQKPKNESSCTIL